MYTIISVFFRVVSDCDTSTTYIIPNLDYYFVKILKCGNYLFNKISQYSLPIECKFFGCIEFTFIYQILIQSLMRGKYKKKNYKTGINYFSVMSTVEKLQYLYNYTLYVHVYFYKPFKSDHNIRNVLIFLEIIYINSFYRYIILSLHLNSKY